MRVKKQRRHRKCLRFFTVCHGFRPPYKILCDGTFIHHLLVNGILPADTALANILSDQVKLFTTRCVLAEVKRLGDRYSESYNAGCNLATARCEHEKRKSAVACITEIIGENNPEHFFVATQDADLRKKLQEIPGVPVIYALRNALFLESPSSSQIECAKKAEEGRSHMTDLEYKMLKLSKKRVVSPDAKDSSLAVEDDETVSRSGIDTKDKVKFKRKRAKGPNPLSCKKKK
ncbi:hypothetical protein M569_01899, partial [Genlisea aurea]